MEAVGANRPNLDRDPGVGWCSLRGHSPDGAIPTDPEGIQASSRWLSAATLPESDAPRSSCTLEGCQLRPDNLRRGTATGSGRHPGVDQDQGQVICWKNWCQVIYWKALEERHQGLENRGLMPGRGLVPGHLLRARNAVGKPGAADLSAFGCLRGLVSGLQSGDGCGSIAARLGGLSMPSDPQVWTVPRAHPRHRIGP